MKKADFDDLLQSIEQATIYAKGDAHAGVKVHTRKIEQSEIAAVRIKAGLTQSEFARIIGASLGTVRKWELGERSPSGAAATLLRVFALDASVVMRAVG
jgi:putative transcriptional regulator